MVPSVGTVAWGPWRGGTDCLVSSYILVERIDVDLIFSPNESKHTRTLLKKHRTVTYLKSYSLAWDFPKQIEEQLLVISDISVIVPL